MNDDHMKYALNSIARRNVPENTNLWPHIAARLERKSFMTVLRTRPVAAILLALLILLALTGVVYAIGSALGYIPGVGLIDKDRLRVLAEPVSQTRAGITLSVEQVVVDSAHTVVLYKVEGLTNANFDDGITNTKKCYSDAVLRLSSEELQSIDRTGEVGTTGYEARVSYPAIPSAVNEFTFALPCIQDTSPGKAPENWELSLRLAPAPADMTIFPVIEIATPGQPVATVTKQAGQASLNPGTISLTLDRAVKMDDGYLFYAAIHWGPAMVGFIDIPGNPPTIRLLDANGQEIMFDLVSDDSNAGVFPDKRQTVIAMKTAPIQIAGPLTLVIDSLLVEASVDASFSFEPGPEPKPGQAWELNQEVHVGDGQSLHVRRATYTTANERPTLSFDMESETITQAGLADVNHALFMPQGGGGSDSQDPGPFTSEFTYAGKFPDDLITVKISEITFMLSGPWKVEWTPPALSSVTPPTHPEACVNLSKFKQALKEKPALPEGLGGRVILFGPSQGNNNVDETTMVDLDGSNPQALEDGRGDGDFSPDGSKVAFARMTGTLEKDGIYITDLKTGETMRLPNTGPGDFNPMWSPDGSQIVFNRGMGLFELYAINADGTNLRRLTYDRGQEYPIGWMPDGQHLLYTVSGMPYQYTDHIVDVQTGKIEYFSNDEFLGMSPDAKYKITAERETSNQDAWVSYFSNMDGSNRWALAESDIVLQNPIWSANGEWLLVSLSKLNSDQDTPVFIHLTDCQIIPLPKLNGIVIDWLP